LEIVLEAGADDVTETEDGFVITCLPDDYEAVSNALQKAGIEPEESQLSLMPKDRATIQDAETAAKVLKLVDMLDDHDDVQRVSSNFDIPDEVMRQLER